MDREDAPAPDAPARAAVEETRAEAEAEKALRAENARLRAEMEELRPAQVYKASIVTSEGV